MIPPVIFWFRRDLRLGDHPALRAAVAAGRGRVAAVFVIDPRLSAVAGPVRRAYLHATLTALDESLGGALIVRHGDPSDELARLAHEVGAVRVVATGDFSPAGRARDQRVTRELGAVGVSVSFVDSPYVVTPGTLTSATGAPWRVFSAFRRRWDDVASGALDLAPDLAPDEVTWVDAASLGTDELRRVVSASRPAYFGDLSDEVPRFDPRVGEKGAHATLGDFLARVDAYDEARDRPASAGTSRVSAHLHFGTLHPRQVLVAVNGTSRGAEVFRAEICWREFYADVVFHHPASTWRVLQPALAHLRVDRDARAVARFQTWARGETGYPLVDAGMRQLLAEGWMHNRVRMVCASFLVKHLHLDWRWGATWFLWRLVDADVASNQHGWQWTAGTGTDPAPFHRIFNPTRQAERYDPAGTYVRRYVDELRDVAAPQCLRPGGGEGLLAASGYVGAMVDLAHERTEALARVAEARALARATRGEGFA